MSLDILDLGGGQAIPADDHGALYGDGVFRTVLVHAGRVVAQEAQARHLIADARAIGLAVDARDGDRVEAAAAELAGQQGSGTQRWSLTSGSAARGYSRGDPMRPRLWLAAAPRPAPWPREGLVLKTVVHRYAEQPRLAGIKHMNRLDNVLARQELGRGDAHEGAMLGDSGHLVGGTMSNIVFCDSRTLFVPALDRCGVAGQTLLRLKSLAADLGVAVAVVRHAPAQILEYAEGVGVCNSVMGLCRVGTWDGRRVGGGALLARLQERLDHPQW